MTVMETKTLALEERVAKGAMFLDEHEPGWRDRIDPDMLDLADCERCVLGQLFGHYWKNPHMVMSQAIDHGFDGLGNTEQDELTEAWKRELAG